jgi:hypothetical protein
MSQRDLVDRLLGTPGADAGCEGGMTLLAEYVERQISGGQDVGELFAPLVEHLRNCPACAEDYHGLMALAREEHGG